MYSCTASNRSGTAESLADLAVRRKNLSPVFLKRLKFLFCYSETLNKEYIKRIHQMSYSSLSDNGLLQIISFLIK